MKYFNSFARLWPKRSNSFEEIQCMDSLTHVLWTNLQEEIQSINNNSNNKVSSYCITIEVFHFKQIWRTAYLAPVLCLSWPLKISLKVALLVTNVMAGTSPQETLVTVMWPKFYSDFKQNGGHCWGRIVLSQQSIFISGTLGKHQERYKRQVYRDEDVTSLKSLFIPQFCDFTYIFSHFLFLHGRASSFPGKLYIDISPTLAAEKRFIMIHGGKLPSHGGGMLCQAFRARIWSTVKPLTTLLPDSLKRQLDAVQGTPCSLVYQKRKEQQWQLAGQVFLGANMDKPQLLDSFCSR